MVFLLIVQWFGYLNNRIIWEQRRYEAAKDLYVHYRDLELSIDCANMLIDKLKKQSKL